MSDNYTPIASDDYIAQSEQEEWEKKENKRYKLWKEEKEAAAAATEAALAPPPPEKKGSLIGGVMETAAQPALGTIDFASDTIGLIPWLKPVDTWWDENSPRSNHPAHKVIRDASSIIIPTLVGGGVVVGSARAATAGMAIPKVTRILGTIGAHAGVDATVTSISSHSKEDHNLAGTLNNWLGWQIPWATRDEDSPDITWKKNVMEAAGLSVGVDLLASTFSLAKALRTTPQDIAAAGLAKPIVKDHPIVEAVETRRSNRTAAQRAETAKRLAADPLGTKYDDFINEPPRGPNARAVTDLDVDPIGAKIDYVRINNNINTTQGRPRSVVDTEFMEKLDTVSPTERAVMLRELFDQKIAPNVTATIGDVKITSEAMNKAVTNLYDKVFKPDIGLKEVDIAVDKLKNTFFGLNQTLGEEEWTIVAKSFSDAFMDIYDPKTMRSSAMITQQAGNTIADTSTAIGLIGDIADTGRQQEIILNKLKLLTGEVRLNKLINNKVDEFKTLTRTGSALELEQWILGQSDTFAKKLKAAKSAGDETFESLEEIARNNPEYLKPLMLAYEATDGEVDQIHKLHRWTENNIGLVKKAFYDAEPEVPSLVVQGLNGVRYNHILSGLAPIRAMFGNATLSALKPASILAGAKLTGDTKTFQKALWTYGGWSENMKRAYKVMGDEWRLAKTKPEEAMMRGRADLRQAKMDNFEALEAMSEVWRKEGEDGKVALWNFAKGMSWYNNNPFVRWGTNSMYAIDGFTNSLMASGVARAKAYDQLFASTGGGFTKDAFNKVQRKLYTESFDPSGLLTDKAAKHAASEIALNLDSDLVSRINQILEKVPAAKPLFMFPRTGINSLKMAWTFAPGSSLVPAMTKARKTLTASTRAEIAEVLAEHGLEYSDEAFATLKSEYIGRQLMGGAVVTGAGMWALEGNLTGNGPQNPGERRRLMNMGWKPLSIRNPITGQWHSYRGLEPFDSLLGMVGDLTYFSDRIDQSITEQFYQKLAFAVSMNVANKTFLSGFEPLVSMFSGDEGAFKRFIVTQGDVMIPFAPTGARSILNNIVTPQLKDVSNDWGALMKNKWKFLYNGNEHLQSQLDIYTGAPINFADPFTASVNAFLPFGKSNSGTEPWRQWLISTGWDSTNAMERNPITKEMITTKDRHWINNWIAKNGRLREQIIELMDDKFMNEKLQEYKKARGFKNQHDFPIKELVVHQELTRIHRRAMRQACSALERYHENYSLIGRQNARVKNALRQGNIQEAQLGVQDKKAIQKLLKQ